MPVFDTSALVPLFHPSHPHHAKAKAAFNGASTVILHPCVILELTTVLRRAAKDAGRDGNKEARQALLALLREPRVRIQDPPDYEAAVDLYVTDPRISFTDAIVAVSQTSFDKVEPVTFDDAIHKAAAVPANKRTQARKTLAAALGKSVI